MQEDHTEPKPAPSITETIDALRDAGGSAWDAIADPRAFLDGIKIVPTTGKPEVFGDLNADDREIVMAAFAAMVLDCHAPQDQMTDEDWQRAEELMEELDPGNVERFRKNDRDK